MMQVRTPELQTGKPSAGSKGPAATEEDE